MNFALIFEIQIFQFKLTNYKRQCWQTLQSIRYCLQKAQSFFLFFVSFVHKMISLGTHGLMFVQVQIIQTLTFVQGNGWIRIEWKSKNECRVFICKPHNQLGIHFNCACMYCNIEHICPKFFIESCDWYQISSTGWYY